MSVLTRLSAAVRPLAEPFLQSPREGWTAPDFLKCFSRNFSEGALTHVPAPSQECKSSHSRKRQFCLQSETKLAHLRHQ